jgi:hypothetical protein
MSKRTITKEQASSYVPSKELASGDSVSDLTGVVPTGTIPNVLIDSVDEVDTKDKTRVYLVATVKLGNPAVSKRVFVSDSITKNQYANNQAVSVEASANTFDNKVRINGSCI